MKYTKEMIEAVSDSFTINTMQIYLQIGLDNIDDYLKSEPFELERCSLFRKYQRGKNSRIQTGS